MNQHLLLERMLRGTPEMCIRDRSRDSNLPSFPNGVVFLPDMMFCLLALKDYGKLYNGEFEDTVSLWLHMAKNHWIDKKDVYKRQVTIPMKKRLKLVTDI